MSLRRSSKSQGKDKKEKDQESHELKTTLKKENFESLPQDEGENPFAPVTTKPDTLVSPVGASAASSAHSDPVELLSPSSETHSGCSQQDEEADGETSQTSDRQKSRRERKKEEKLKKEAEKKEREQKEAERKKEEQKEAERKEAEKREKERKDADKKERKKDKGNKNKGASTSSQESANQDRQSSVSPQETLLSSSSSQRKPSEDHTISGDHPGSQILDSKQQNSHEEEPKRKPTDLQLVSHTITSSCLMDIGVGFSSSCNLHTESMS